MLTKLKRRTFERILSRVQVATFPGVDAGSMIVVFSTPVGKSANQAQRSLLIVAERDLHQQQIPNRRAPHHLLYREDFVVDGGVMFLGIVYER